MSEISILLMLAGIIFIGVILGVFVARVLENVINDIIKKRS